MDDKKTKTKDCDNTKKDNVKREDGVTTSSHTRDTAGGGRGTFSNAYGDVPMSILQQRHTENTHHNIDNFHNQHDHNHKNAKEAGAAARKRQETTAAATKNNKGRLL